MQGVAEVVPVSSSAQLHLLPWLAGWPAVDERTTFAAGLHLGSAIGLAAALRPDSRELADVLPATVPAAVAGLLVQDLVERRLGRPGPTAALLAAAGLALLVADRRPAMHPVSRADRAAAGVAQVIALAPGVSRAGATLTALRLRGVRRDDALRASLVMSLPVTVGAAVLTAARSRRTPAVVPSLVAGVASYATARWVVGTSRLYSGSALYRLGLAGAVAARLRKENR
ncbi:MAG: Bacitracin resistance protein BacA [Frankiales bacterium]|nr:Bacitracin resistance protein BacA [Frankiales bacterium]